MVSWWSNIGAVSVKISSFAVKDKDFSKGSGINSNVLANPMFALLVTCMSLVILAPQPVTGQSNNMVNVTGDVVIGAMFPIHALDDDAKCGTSVNDQAGIQSIEALLFALDKVNAEVLKGVDFSLGVLAFDTCYSDTVALDRALQFVKLQTSSLGLDTMLQCMDNSRPIPIDTGKLIGVVGAATSSVSIQLVNFLRLFKIPLISYSATSPELSDTKRYDFFMRTIASDEYQAKAIVQILSTFEWKYVACIYEDTSYGIMGFEEISKQAENAGVCIAEQFEVKRYFSSHEEKQYQLEGVVKTLTTMNNTRGRTVVIIFASLDIVSSIFDIVLDLGLEKRFIWVGGDAWTGYKIKSRVQHVAGMALGVQPKIQEIKAFDKYYLGLDPQTNTRNPWFKEYWEQTFNCSLGSGRGKRVERPAACKDEYTLSDKDGSYEKNLNAYSVMDAVYVFAMALRQWHSVMCPGSKSLCRDLQDAKVEDLITKGYLQNVNFTDPAGLRFSFHNNSGPARYSIMQYFDTVEDGHAWREVGEIEGNSDFGHLDWYNNIDLTSMYEPSICSEPCKNGEAMQPIPHRACCWTCKSCTNYEYLQVSSQSCLECPFGMQTNSTKSGCEDIPESTMDMSNIWAITSIILSCFGVIVTCMMAGLFYWQKETPVIMASGKELSFVLLFGIFMSYVSTFTFVAYPTVASCGATRLLLGSSYTVCYAAILVKTNRIYRVFNIHTSKPKKVTFISAKSQLLITVGIVSVELAALASWLIFDVPKVVYEYPTRAENVRVCEDSMDFAYMGALLYPFILMILCVYYAIKTRKTPDGFNETRYITFGSYSFCVLWIAFTSIYFSVKNNTIRIVALCFASIINATVTLITLFVTKAYVVLFRPMKNTRENVMSRRRTHSYDTVNLSNISRMASAVSTWHSVANNPGGPETNHTAPVTNGGHGKKFGQNLSVSVVSMNNIGGSIESLYSDKSHVSSVSAPPVHRPFTTEELDKLTHRTSKDLGDERLKQFLELNHVHDTDEDDDDQVQGGIGSSGIPRRSMRSFRSRKKRRRTLKRARSLDAKTPNIIVTSCSTEDNSKNRVKVIHF